MNLLVASLLVLAQTISFPNPDSESWIDSPEAYFVTHDEQREWFEIENPQEREAFQKRYWLKRDPTPGTETNELQDAVLSRIDYADQTFSIGDTPGSRTARGYVFIVFGSPARASQRYAGGPTQRPTPGLEGTDILFRWIWDRERTPQLVNALGRPRFEVDILLEPDRRRDRVMNPGLVSQYRDLLAEKSIVNPDLIGPTAPAPERIAWLERTGTAMAPAEESGVTIDPALDSALVWSREGNPRAIFWYVDPSGGTTAPRFTVRLHEEGTGKGITWSGQPAATRQLLSTTPGTVWSAALELEPGSWTGTFGAGPEHERTVSFEVPEGGTSPSSLLLSGGPQSDPPNDPLVHAGPLLLPLRADATFTPGESLWYFLQLRGEIPEGTTIEPRLMKEGAGIVSVFGAFEPEAMRLSEDLHALGYEIPLETMAAGRYILYVTLRTPGGDPVVRRGEFQVVDR